MKNVKFINFSSQLKFHSLVMAVDTTSSNIVYIDLIDRGLKDYYTALKVDTYWDVKEDKGEFKKYCENNGLEVTKNYYQ